MSTCNIGMDLLVSEQDSRGNWMRGLALMLVTQTLPVDAARFEG